MIKRKRERIGLKERRNSIAQSARADRDRNSNYKKKNVCLGKKRLTEDHARIVVAQAEETINSKPTTVRMVTIGTSAG